MLLVITAVILAQVQPNLNKPLDKPATAAFGAALMVPETVTLVASFPYNHLDPIAITTAVDAGSGGSSVRADGGHAVLTVGTTGYAEMRTRLSARYFPGQGMSARFTLQHTGCHSNQEMEVGAGDSADMFAFGCCPSCGVDGGASFGVLRRSNGVDNWVPSERWNGAWGRVAPDITKGRPYQIQWQWLGYGQITYSIEDAQTGGFVVAHAVKYAGTASETSISNPTLPLRAEVWSVGSDAGQTLRVPSMAMIRQGTDPDKLGVRRAFQNSRTASTTEANLFTLRNEPTFNGRTNRSQVTVDGLSWYNDGNQEVIIRLWLNAAVPTAVYNQVTPFGTVRSNGDAGFTGGYELLSIVAGSKASDFLSLADYGIRLAPGDTLTVTAQATTGTQLTRVALTWLEEL